MGTLIKFCSQMGYLNQMINKNLITDKEYELIKEYIMRKYNIGIYKYKFK